MQLSRVVICFCDSFAKLLFGQQGSVVRLSTLSSGTGHVSKTPGSKPKLKVAGSAFTVLVANFRQSIRAYFRTPRMKLGRSKEDLQSRRVLFYPEFGFFDNN